MNVLTRESLLDNSADSWIVQQEHADRIAMELTKADKSLNTVHSMRKRFNLLNLIIRSEQESIAIGDAIMDPDLADDQIEDWFIARVARVVCETELGSADPLINMMKSEFAIHGFKSPHEAGHRFGD